MQKKADNQKYAEDKPKDCSYCYFWNSRKNGCSKEECYYRLLPEEPFEEKEETWCCEGCPYGRYSPCIGYCLQKILLEIKQKKAVREKEGDCLAGGGLLGSQITFGMLMLIIGIFLNSCI